MPETVVFSGEMRRSTLWFALAAAWAVLLFVNLLRHHHDLNTLVIALAAAAFAVAGVIFRRREAKQPLRQPKFK